MQELEALLTTYIQRGAGLESQILRAIGDSLPQVSTGPIKKLTVPVSSQPLSSQKHPVGGGGANQVSNKPWISRLQGLT